VRDQQRLSAILVLVNANLPFLAFFKMGGLSSLLLRRISPGPWDGALMCCSVSLVGATLQAGIARDMTLSIAWAVFALVLLGLGTWARRQGLRWVSLGFTLLTVARVFLYDLGKLEGLYRVASMAGLAFSLLAVSRCTRRWSSGTWFQGASKSAMSWGKGLVTSTRPATGLSKARRWWCKAWRSRTNTRRSSLVSSPAAARRNRPSSSP
jgi:Predicted membrane protein (DUF2339)